MTRFVDKPRNPRSTLGKDTTHVDDISMSYSLSKGIIAVFQTLYTSFTLYETRGNQIDRFEYAAFGLTVAPYLVMSLVNLASNVMTPDFDCIYLVRDSVMDEVEVRKGVVFERVDGELKTHGSDFEMTEITPNSSHETAEASNVHQKPYNDSLSWKDFDKEED